MFFHKKSDIEGLQEEIKALKARLWALEDATAVYEAPSRFSFVGCKQIKINAAINAMLRNMGLQLKSVPATHEYVTAELMPVNNDLHTSE